MNIIQNYDIYHVLKIKTLPKNKKNRNGSTFNRNRWKLRNLHKPLVQLIPMLCYSFSSFSIKKSM